LGWFQVRGSFPLHCLLPQTSFLEEVLLDDFEELGIGYEVLRMKLEELGRRLPVIEISVDEHCFCGGYFVVGENFQAPFVIVG
jgi:hypothetical protein